MSDFDHVLERIQNQIERMKSTFGGKRRVEKRNEPADATGGQARQPEATERKGALGRSVWGIKKGGA